MMKSPFCDIDKAFHCLEETLVWTQDKSPHISSTFTGVVLQGAMETQSAGIQTGQLLADSWTIRVPNKSLIIDKIAIGDIIERGCWKTTILNVQQVYTDATGDFWILCTAEERAPLG